MAARAALALLDKAEDLSCLERIEPVWYSSSHTRHLLSLHCLHTISPGCSSQTMQSGSDAAVTAAGAVAEDDDNVDREGEGAGTGVGDASDVVVDAR